MPREQVHNPATDHGAPEGSDPSAQSYRYGPTNTELQSLNRDRNLSQVRGYPSDAEYMKTVANSNLERDQTQMSDMGRRAAAAEGTAKPSSFKQGGVVQKTGTALVHKGEVIIPVGPYDRANSIPGRLTPLPLRSRVVADADALEAKGYTGDNAPWRK
jgi:hypothetical protein